LGSGSNNSGSSSSKTTNNGGGKNGDSKKNGNGNNRGIGTLRKVYENLVTKDGEFYELAAVITNPGSKRQQIHPDLPYQNDNGAPLYVVFLALQVSTVSVTLRYIVSVVVFVLYFVVLRCVMIRLYF
jgi:hypothetical protein